MAETLRLEIVTPEAIVFSEDVEHGHAAGDPGADRRVSPARPADHADRARRDHRQQAGEDRFLAVGEGLVEISGDEVVIVTDMAIPADHIDEAKAEEARERAAARLNEKLEDEEVATVNASLARSLAQLEVKRSAAPVTPFPSLEGLMSRHFLSPRVVAIAVGALVLPVAPAATQSARPRVVIVATGGTIAGIRRVHDRRRLQVGRGRRRHPHRRRAATEEARGRARRAGVIGRQPGHERRAVGEAGGRGQSAAGAVGCRRRGDHARHRHDGGDGVLPQPRREERQAGGPHRLDATVHVAQRRRAR